MHNLNACLILRIAVLHHKAKLLTGIMLRYKQVSSQMFVL